MKVSKRELKGVINLCLHKMERGQNGEYLMPRTFTDYEDLILAGSVMGKLKIDIDETTGKFSDTEIEFVPTEIAFVKKMFDLKMKEGFDFNLADSVKELKELFDGKKNEDKK